MSKLDYVTIAIVAICILAIVFLVYKMTDLFGGTDPADPIENTSGTIETEGGDTYDLSEDLTGDASSDDNSTAPTPGTTGTQPNTGTSTQPTPTVEGDDEEVDYPSSTSSSSYNSAGKYMVIAGTFTMKNLAENEAARLRRNGYENAKVEIFDRGKYAVVLVDRFTNMADAERLTNKLRSDGVKAFIKTKERG